MKKVLTLTLNPAIDVRYNFENFRTGEVNRPNDIEKNAGGKGINVSRVLFLLGTEALATGIVGGFTGKLFLSKLKKEAIFSDFLEGKHEIRTCLAVIAENIEGISEILESVLGNKKLFFKFLEKYKHCLEGGFHFVCGSGSLLNDLPKESYQILIEEARKKGIKFILDTSGEALLHGIKAGPFLVKPNLEELRNISSKKIKTIPEMIEAGKEILRGGTENVMITLGEEGALFITEGRVFQGKIPKVIVKNTVGSGDATIAGFVHSLCQGESIKEAFRFGLACGTTNAMLDGTGVIDSRILRDLLKKIEIIEL